MAPDLHDKMKKSRHIVLSFDGARRESGLGAAAWILWLRNEYGTFEKVFYGGRVLMNASAMIAEREALRMGIEHLTVLFPTEVSSFDFQVEYHQFRIDTGRSKFEQTTDGIFSRLWIPWTRTQGS